MIDFLNHVLLVLLLLFPGSSLAFPLFFFNPYLSPSLFLFLSTSTRLLLGFERRLSGDPSTGRPELNSLDHPLTTTTTTVVVAVVAAEAMVVVVIASVVAAVLVVVVVIV